MGKNRTILGHGTFMQDESLCASLAGVVERVNKLIKVRPVKSRYNGEIGDIVVGRITEVQQKRWKVDTKSRLDSVLLLSSVNLPAGEVRRKSAEDELAMRQYLQEGDLISAEVQNVFSDGALSLHTRSLKYGKLSQGCLLTVPPSLVKRSKNHFHCLPFGASVILGNNGYVWISPTINEDSNTGGGFVQNLETVSKPERLVIARVRNIVELLVQNKVMLSDTTIIVAYEYTCKAGFQVKDLLKPNVMKEIAVLAIVASIPGFAVHKLADKGK
uniref:EOG090X09DD n=1 Tax=Lynceus sp. MCZ IZ 141354 TaxID=1930659 RepID=A0A9N6WRB8_9CRUS|nr:EOG090X09DD [Lynceus sp. MCZ IZ 141354]